MHTTVKVALTAAAIVAIAWPLLFWERAQTAPRHLGEASYPTAEQREQPMIYNRLDHHPLFW